MHRVFKFRAWNGSRMIYNVAVRNNRMVNHIDLYVGGKMVIMQHTGLIDVKLVPIYEGDIVVNRNNYGSKYVVEYYETGFRGISKDGDDFGPYTLNLYINNKNPILDIVGNIYENPELFTL